MLFNPLTLKKIDKYVEDPFQTLMLIGAKGSGKSMATRYIVENITNSNFDTYPYKIAIDGSTQGIESIRNVKKEFSQIFVSKNDSDKRFLIVSNIDLISRESIPAMLKAIEEPPEQTHVIMLANELAKVPQTILSRSHRIDILPVSKNIAKDYLKKAGHNDSEAEKIWLKNSGLPAKIVSSSSSHIEDESMMLAKEFLAKKIYDRLVMVAEYSKFDKIKQAEIIDAMVAVIDYKIGFSTKNILTAKEMAEKLDKLQTAKSMLRANVNQKLIWTDLSLYL